jgi:hypothetical protein
MKNAKNKINGNSVNDSIKGAVVNFPVVSLNLLQQQ